MLLITMMMMTVRARTSSMSLSPHLTCEELEAWGKQAPPQTQAVSDYLYNSPSCRPPASLHHYPMASLLGSVAPNSSISFTNKNFCLS